MTFKHLIQPDGSVLSEDGVYFETPKDFVCHRLGFCGCGVREDAMRFVRDVLDEIGKRGPESRIADLCGSSGVMYFAYYYLDDRELTEHGSCVPGWLTEKGRAMLADLNEMLDAR